MGQLGRFCHQMEVPEEGKGRSGPARKPSKAIAVVTPEKKSHRLVISSTSQLSITEGRKKKKKHNLLHGKGSLRGAIHSSWYLSAMSTYSWYPFKSSAARINTASKFCFEARQAEETSTWEFALCESAGMLLWRSNVRSQPREHSLSSQVKEDRPVQMPLWSWCVPSAS